MSEHTRYLGFNEAGDPSEEFFTDLDNGAEFEGALFDSIEHVKQSFDYVPGRTRFLAITVKVVDDVR